MNLATFSSRAVAVCMPTSILPPRTATGRQRRLTAEVSSSIPTPKPSTCRHHPRRHRHRHHHRHRDPYRVDCKHRSSLFLLPLASASKERGIAAIPDDAPRGRGGPWRKGACGTFALGSGSRCGQPRRMIGWDAPLLQVHQVDETPRRGCWMQLVKGPSSVGPNVSDKDPNGGRGGRRRWLSVLQGAAARDDKGGGAFLGRSEGDTSLRSSSGIEDRSFVKGDSAQLEEENPTCLDKSSAPERQDYDGQDSDLLYFAKFAGICVLAAATIKYGSVALPSLAKPNLPSALFMVTVPMGASAIALVSASADEKGDPEM